MRITLERLAAEFPLLLSPSQAEDLQPLVAPTGDIKKIVERVLKSKKDSIVFGDWVRFSNLLKYGNDITAINALIWALVTHPADSVRDLYFRVVHTRWKSPELNQVIQSIYGEPDDFQDHLLAIALEKDNE